MTVQQQTGGQALPGQWTIAAVLNWTKQYFDGKGLESSRLDAEVLLSSILQKDRLYLYVHFDQPLESGELAAYRESVRRRAAGEPVAYITGRREFMALEFIVSPAVLIPRPDTEILVEAVLELLQGAQQPLVADVGTGSGAIIISLLQRLPAARGLAVELSAAAAEVAAANACCHQVAERLEIRQGDLLAPLAGCCVDALVSNPPYIPTGDIAGLAREVRKEPRQALDGGSDGLDFYRRLVAGSGNLLKPGGFLAVEVGFEQAEAVAALAAGQDKLTLEKIIPDYAGIQRVVIFRQAGE